MKIITEQQEILELILEYWDNPSAIALETTLNKIGEIYLLGRQWSFCLTDESLINLSKKYLNRDLQINEEQYTLWVDCTTLSFRILSWEEYVENYEEMRKTTPIGL